MDPFKCVLSVTYRGELDDDSLKKLRNKKKFLNKALRIAELNGLYYFFVLKINEMGVDLTSEDQFNREIERLDKLKRTLNLLNIIAKEDGINHIIIKSCMDIPHVPRDIDILIHSNEKDRFIQALKNRGFDIAYSTDVETALSKNGYMKVDIYTETRYITFPFLSESFLWKSSISKKAIDDIHLMLNDEANLLLLLVHSVYGHRSMTLLDFIQINLIISKAHLSRCKQYAEENDWLATFMMVLNKFCEVRSLVDSGMDYGQIFPYKFSPSFILNSINNANHIKLSRKTYMFLHISFVIDSFIHEIKKYRIYDLLIRDEFIKTSFNSFNYFVRHACGDTKSK